MNAADIKVILEKILMPYQRRWVEDQARFKIGMWSRQTGKSFATACEAVSGCLLVPGDLWVVLSAGERQALEWMEKAKIWAKAFGFIVDSYDELRNSFNATLTRAEIRFSNGSRIVAIPANPDTARGYSGNLILDEFAIHEKSWDIWAAIYPSITNPLKGEKKVRIVSTPKGRANKFYDLWTKNDVYSKHKVTIEDAKEQGLPVNIEALKAGVDDSDIWAQEFMCEFIDSSGVLLPYDLISPCESNKVRVVSDSPYFFGMDIGRSRDLTVLAIGQKVGDVLGLAELHVYEKTPFHTQLKLLKDHAARLKPNRICIDATGIGAMLAEEARRSLGGFVEPVTFTSSTKGEMFGQLRRRFEERTIVIPSERLLREDLHSVTKNVSGGGRISYSADRSTDGHADRASAIALMVRAATSRICNETPIVFPNRTSYENQAI